MSKHRFKTARLKNADIPNYLPWLYFVDEGFLVTKNSLLLAFFELYPLGDYYNGYADEASLNCFNRFLMNLPDSTAIWYEWRKIEGRKDKYSSSSDLFSLPLSKALEEERDNLFRQDYLSYSSSRVLTLTFAPSISRNGIMKESYEEFDKLIADMESRFHAVNIKTHRLGKDEVCTYLHDSISSKRYDIKTPSASSYSLSDALWDDDIDTTLIPLKLGDRYIQTIAIDDFPDTGTNAEMLTKITNIDASIRWVTRYISKSPDKAKKLIDDKRRRYYSKRFGTRDIVAHAVFNSEIELQDSSQITNVNECDLAMQENGNICNYGFYSGLFVIEASSEKELKSVSDRIQKVLTEKGFIYREETINLFASWLSSLPGNVEANSRRQFISTGNVSSVVSLTTLYKGNETNNHLLEQTGIGAPNAIALLRNGDLYNLNLNGDGDVGHTFVIGPTGAGKSVLLLFLASSWLKYPDSRVIYFNKSDAKGTTRPFVEGNNGRVYYPGKDTTTFQPLRNASQNIERCMRFLSSIASVQKIDLKATDRKNMEEALRLLVPGTENLTIFRQLLEGYDHKSEFVAALSSYVIPGTWGSLFDATEDTLNPHDWKAVTSIEMGGLMDMGDGAIIPALTYITSQMDELFMDRKPTLLILDEAWVFFSHPVFRDFIVTWLKTLRKLNVFVVMATQEANDADELMTSILANTHTKIILPDKNAKSGPLKDIYSSIGLTETDLEVIASDGMRPKKNYYIVQPEGKAVVDFMITKSQLELLQEGLYV